MFSGGPGKVKMSDFQHALVGGVIFMIIWMTIGRKLFKSDKDKQSWEEWKDLFRKY